MTASAWTVLIAEDRSHLDREINLAVRAYASRHPTAQDLPGRLEAIEQRIAEKDQTLKAERLSHYVYREATKRGVPWELVQDIPFDDEQAAVAKLEQLEAAVAARALSDTRAAYADNRVSPGAPMAPTVEPKSVQDWMNVMQASK